MIKKLQITFSFLLLSMLSFGQTFPVGVTVQVAQPSPIYLSHYADINTLNSPLTVQLLLTDLSILNRQVRLKCYWQGNGISFVNNDFVVGAQPIYLSGGSPVVLTKSELAPYFEFQNLQGINPNSYAEALPEGIYNVCFEVYDFITGKKLSKKSCTTTIIFQNEPPFLNLPFNAAGIQQQNIQNIAFSWTPRHINVSNVEYEFKLVEIWDNNTPVQNAFFNSPALYTTTTQGTTLQYGIGEPQLIAGRKYAWGIRAKALKNAEEIGVFKNNGYSEIFSFDYEVNCSPPVAIATASVGKEEAKIQWSGEVSNYEYQIKYREKSANSKWYDLVTAREYITLTGLKPNTTYQYTIGASCEPKKYTHSAEYEFTTLAESESAFAGCNLVPNPIDLVNKNPLPELLKNDVVKAGDYPIVVTKVSGSNGTFSGEGYVTFPFLAKVKALIDAASGASGSNAAKFTRIKVSFSGVGINTDFQLISGAIVATYDATWGGIIDTDVLEEQILGTNGNISTITVDYPIVSIVNNGNGTVTITGEGGQTSLVTVSAGSMVITDSNGVPWTVPVKDQPTKGDVAPGGIPTPSNTAGISSSGAVTQISSKDVKITFKTNTTSYYSFDKYPTATNKLSDTYESIPMASGGNYKVNYKAISNVADRLTDTVLAEAVFENGKKAEDIVFKTPQGISIPATWSGNTATLTLKKTLDYAKDAILATVKPKDSTGKYEIAGKLNLYQLQSKKINVTLLGINGYSVPSNAKADLDAIYGKAGYTFDVTIKNNITIDNTWGESLECGTSDLLDTYTDEQNQLVANVKKAISYQANTYYIVYTNAKTSRSLQGFMPLKGQFGFLFSPSGTAGIKTLAHELGHGVFGLQHPFTKYGIPEGSTSLLMDYGTGTDLSHNDWEMMHAPGLQLYKFTQGDSAGEQATVVNIEGLKDFRNADGSYTFITPAGKPITLSSSLSMVEFSTGDDYNLVNCNDENFKIYPFGTLRRFKISDTEYFFCGVCNSEQFSGYFSKAENGNCATNSKYSDTLTKSTYNKVIVGFPAVDGANIIFKVGQIQIPSITPPKDYYGSGKFMEYDEIVKRIGEITKYHEVYAKFDPEFDPEIKQFIIENVRKQGWDGSEFYENDSYVFIHATQLQKNSILKNCFKTGVPGRLLKFITKYVKNYTYSSSGIAGISVPVESGTIEVAEFSDSHEENSEKFNAKSLINHWKKYDINFYRNISNALKNFNIPEKAESKDVYDLVLPLLDNTSTDNWDCFFDKFTVEAKIVMIDKLIEGNVAFDKSEELIVNIISTINKVEDIKLFLGKLKTTTKINDYLLFTKIWNELDDSERPKFSFKISEWINRYDRKIKNIEVTNSYLEKYYKYITKNNFGNYDIAKTNVFELYNTNFTESYLNKIYTELESEDIKLKEEFSDLLNITPRLREFKGKPFDDVVILIKDDFPEYGLTAGQKITVPAILLYNISEKINSTHRASGIRIFFDALAIATAPITAGASTSILVIETGVATTDILVTINRKEIKATYGSDELALWDTANTIWNFYMLGRAICTTLFKVNSSVTTIKNIDKIELSLKNISNNADEFFNSTASTSDKLKFIQRLDEFIHFIKNSKGITALDNFIFSEGLLELRFRLQKVIDIESSILDVTVKSENLVVKSTGLSLGKIDLVENTVALTKNVRWLPLEIKQVKVLSSFKDIGYYLPNANTLSKTTIEIVENLSKKGDYYVRPKALPIANSLSSLAEKAFAIYAPKLPEAIKQIENITGNLGVVTGRAKRAESAVNRLERAIQNGWVSEIKDVDTALENIWDAVGTRIILNDAKPENVDVLITNLCAAIENKSISIIKVNNLKGNNGIGYLSGSNIAKLEQSVSKATGKPFSIIEGDPYESGYTTVTVYIQYANKVKGELQIIGKNALEIANAEHWVYDAFLGKPYMDYINAMSSPETKNLSKQLIEGVRKPAELLNSADKQLYNNYLTEVYKNARKIEAELPVSSVNLPANINKSLSIENLLKVDEYIIKLKNGTANIQEINNFLNLNHSGNLVVTLDNSLFSILKGKYNELDEILKSQFLEDFANASDDVLKKLQDENLFDLWKNDIRSNNLNELRDAITRPNIRAEYAGKVESLANRRLELIKMGKSKLDIAKELFESRRNLTIEYKKITPEDFQEWIFKRNEFEYVQTSTGDKWGLTWDGALSKYANGIVENISNATPEQLDQIHDKIAESASYVFKGATDKMKLGKNFDDYFKPRLSSSEYASLVVILKKYRMYTP